MESRGLRPEDDLLAISRIYEESWKQVYQGIIPQSYLDSIPAGLWALQLQQEGRHTMVMLDGENYIGTASFGASRFVQFDGYGEIVSIYLLPAYMGQGHGRPLLDACLTRLFDLGYRDAFLWVLAENVRARRFYERAGFCLCGHEREESISGRMLREIAYCLHLQAAN